MDSTAQNNASIVSALIDDVIIMVFECLDVVDILRIRQTCKYLAALTQSKQLWSHILFRTVIKRNIPLLPYTRSFQVLSSTEVEIVASHALRLRKQTIAPPQLRRQLVLSLDQSRSVSWLQLVRGQWLLAAFSDTQTSIIRIWSVMDLLSNFGKSSPVAEAYLEAPVASGMVQTRDDQLYIALYLRGSEPSIDVLTLFTCDERLAFSCVAHFPGAAHLRCFDEDWIGYALHHEISVPSLLNWNTGDFIHLRKTPDMRGGCIAMARWNDYVAVINPISLELYRRDDQSYCLWGEVDLPCPVGFAEFALADSAEHLTFCLSCERGVFVYQVVFELPHDTPQLKLVWTYRPKQYELSRPYICKPRFGVTQRTLTWIDTPSYESTRYCSFVYARLPRLGSVFRPPFFIVDDSSLPAQYFMGVRDFDEARGIAVFGNGFGELALYDFSHSDPQVLDTALKPLCFPALIHQQPMPTVPILSVPAPPFPYGGWAYESQEEQTLLFNYWRSFSPSRLPMEWNTDWEKSRNWRQFVDACDLTYGLAWTLENATFYLGTIIPLMRKDGLGGEEVIFIAGGLLFAYTQDSEYPSLLDPSLPYLSIFNSLDAGGRIWSFVIMECNRTDQSKISELLRADKMWMYERQKLNRNRWEEMQMRGGEVRSRFLKPLRDRRWILAMFGLE